MLREKLEERRVAQILFKISALIQIFRVDFRHGQAVFAKMLGELQEGDVFFAHVVQNPDRALLPGGKPDNIPSRAAELALKRLYLRGRRVKMLLKQFLQNVHIRERRSVQRLKRNESSVTTQR